MILNKIMVLMTEKEDKISEGRAGFMQNRSCVDHVYTLDKIFQGRKDAGLATYGLFLDVRTESLPHGMEKSIVGKTVGNK